jgi:hypothetical protein
LASWEEIQSWSTAATSPETQLEWPKMVKAEGWVFMWLEKRLDWNRALACTFLKSFLTFIFTHTITTKIKLHTKYCAAMFEALTPDTMAGFEPTIFFYVDGDGDQFTTPSWRWLYLRRNIRRTSFFSAD